MCTYNSTASNSVKAAILNETFEHDFVVRKKDSPEFRRFVSHVNDSAEHYELPDIPEWKLHRLYFVSNAFRKHWESPGTKNTETQLAYTCWLNGLDNRTFGPNQERQGEAYVMVLAWMRKQGRFPSDKDREALVTSLQGPWNAAEAELRRRRQVKNEQRRKNYMSKGKKKVSVSQQIVAFLNGRHVSTPLEISEQTGINQNSVATALKRLKEAGKVECRTRGLYEISTGRPSALESTKSPTCSAMPANQPPKRDSFPTPTHSQTKVLLFADDIDTEMSEDYMEPDIYSREATELPSSEMENMPSLDMPTLPSAEPRWSRR
jgi:predicted transcriptional regulator